MTEPGLSIVVPTRNREQRLQATVSAILRQTYPEERRELIVVDDGSTGDTARLVRALGEAGVTYVRQPHLGAAAARNTGAARAAGDLLVFVDDDIELLPDAVEGMVEAHRRRPHAVIVGRLSSAEPQNRFQELQVIPERRGAPGCAEIGPGECLTGLLAIARSEFFALGGFQDPTGGWPSWDDVDLGYRASRAGLSILRSSEARGVHHDESSTSLERTAERWYCASKAAVRLFRRHPGIQDSLPFYRDKLPIRWRRDPPVLIARKAARSAISVRVLLEIVARIAPVLVHARLPAFAVRPLCGYVISGSMWHGIRAGIEAYGPFDRGTVSTPRC